MILEKYGFDANSLIIKEQTKNNFERRLNRSIFAKYSDILYDISSQVYFEYLILNSVIMLVLISFFIPNYYELLITDPFDLIIYIFESIAIPMILLYLLIKLTKMQLENLALYPDLNNLSIVLITLNNLINLDTQYIESALKDQDYLIKKNAINNNFEYSDTLKQKLILPSITVKTLSQPNSLPQNSETITFNDLEHKILFPNVCRENLRPIKTDENIYTDGKEKPNHLRYSTPPLLIPPTINQQINNKIKKSKKRQKKLIHIKPMPQTLLFLKNPVSVKTTHQNQYVLNT